MDARIVELASTTKLPAEEVVVAVHAELSKRFDAIENELFALIDGLQVQRATTLRDNLTLAEELSAGFQLAGAAALRKVLSEVRLFLFLFEPYMNALRASTSLHPCVTFDMVDHRTGKKSRAAMPPMTAVAFASDMDTLLKKLAKARSSLRIKPNESRRGNAGA
jgi:hypothetical protein